MPQDAEPLLEETSSPTRTSKGYISTSELFFRNPKTDPPPLGTSLHILTSGGQVVRGHWSHSPDRGFIAWAPFPKIPEWARLLLRQR